MADRMRVVTADDQPIRSHADAAKVLGDQPYIAYCLVQAMKLAIALLSKRWPQLK